MLEDKLKLEAGFLPLLRGYNGLLVRNFVALFVRGENIDAASQLVALLSAHYFKVSAVFSRKLSDQMPPAVAVTPGERAVIDSALSTWIVATAGAHAAAINDTNQESILRAVTLAEETPEVSAESGRNARILTAVTAGGFLSRMLRAREKSIATTETQIAAETARATEAEVLAGLPPSIEGGIARKSPLKKMWVARGDSIMRRHHADADGQIQLLNQPFIVMGERLLWPGDVSLGASAENVINCRCEAEYDAQAIIDSRQVV